MKITEEYISKLISSKDKEELNSQQKQREMMSEEIKNKVDKYICHGPMLSKSYKYTGIITTDIANPITPPVLIFYTGKTATEASKRRDVLLKKKERFRVIKNIAILYLLSILFFVALLISTVLIIQVLTDNIHHSFHLLGIPGALITFNLTLLFIGKIRDKLGI